MDALILILMFPISIVVLLKLIQPRKSLAHEKYKMEQNNVLTNLPVDVLEQITKRLSLKDCLALRATCHSCSKTISNAIKNMRCCHLPEMPQVSLQSKNSIFFFSLSKKSVHHRLRTPLKKLTNKCIGSVEGWLIISDYSEKKFEKIFFLNPVTDVRIMIPSKLSMPSNNIQRVRKMVASSKPNCDGSSDCYLAGLFSDFCHIAIYKLFDKSWTIVESDKDSGSYFMDIEIIGTKLYVTDSPSKSILIYCLKDTANGPPKVKVLAEFPTIGSSEPCIFPRHCISSLGKDEARRELYLITRLYFEEPEYETQHVMSDHLRNISAYPEPPRFTNFEVFMLDDTNKDTIGWRNVQLEDRVAFVSNLQTIVMPRDELNFNKDLIRGNSIYFAFYSRCPTNPWSGLQLGMFCLTDRSIKYFPVEKSKLDGVPFPIWFVPSLL